jgi:anti-anti-sigma factor
MTILKRNVQVKQSPEVLGGKQGKSFLREVEKSLEMERPRLVLDCSRVRQMDRSGVLLLLCCLEEALKRNGDMRLAGVQPGVRAALERTGASRVLEMYESTAAAVNSFHLPNVAAFAVRRSNPVENAA